jgi:hypothetical protein
MTKYSLIDANEQVIREGEFTEKPADPVGKGWRWVEVIDQIPQADAGEQVTNIVATFDAEKDAIVKTAEVTVIPLTKEDVNAERDLRLATPKVKNIAGVGDTLVKFNQEYVNSLQSLVLAALVYIQQNQLDITMTFRDENNKNWSMTPTQVLDLFMAIELEIRDTIEASWLIKDDKELPATLEDLKKDPRWP